MKKTTNNFWGSSVYQIYPRSFKDSNGDGIGDLRGISSKLDYLQWLGVNAIWVSPFYTSPMVDFGYDISNYCDVDPLFGSLKDFDQLVHDVHRKGMKLLIDFVPNHTSDQHEWFEKSRSSRDNPKRNWYVWHDPKPDGSPPNNWLSVFGGSAWQFDKTTNQYYLHSFLKEQPDLNWRNFNVREVMKDVLHFWLKRGVDGFRVDAVYWLAKDEQFRDDPPNPHFVPRVDSPYDSLIHKHSRGEPRLLMYLKELAEVAKSYGDRYLITEAYPEKRFEFNEYLNFYKVDPAVLSPFNFESLYLPWNAVAFKQYIDVFQARLQPSYMPVYVNGNHDSMRLASRVGQHAARAMALMSLTLPGTPFIYYGDEIGMENTPISKTQTRDPFGKNVPKRNKGRDPERSPMQWSPQRYAGFSRVKSWLPVGKTYRLRDVETEKQNPHSILNLYKELLSLRAQTPALKYGSYKPLEGGSPEIFGFFREYGQEKLAIIINFSRKKHLPMPVGGTLVATTSKQKINHKNLAPLEARIVRLK